MHHDFCFIFNHSHRCDVNRWGRAGLVYKRSCDYTDARRYFAGEMGWPCARGHTISRSIFFIADEHSQGVFSHKGEPFCS